MIYRILNWIYDSKVLRVVVALLVFCLIPPSTSAQSVTIPDLLNTLTFEGELVGISPDGTFILFFSSEDRALLTKDIYGNDVQVISDLQHPMDLQFITNTLVYVNYSTNDQPLAELLDVVSGTRFDTYRGSVRRAEINGDYTNSVRT
jgi:hypothetical protein